MLENNANLKGTIEELDRFAYVVSHGLQESLRKIQVFSDKIMMQYHSTVDEQMKHSLDKIVRAAERMQVLIADLLRFSRGTDGKEEFIDLDLNGLLSKVVSDMEVDIERSKAKISIDTLPRIWAIPSQMRQLF